MITTETPVDTGSAPPRKAAKAAPKRPVARAPAVLDHLESNKRVFAALELKIAELALAVAEKKPGAQEKLAALHDKIRAATFEIDGNARAHDLALRLDKEAIADWRTAVLALPAKQLVEGISNEACCKLCEVDFCVISGTARCNHPKNGGLMPGDKTPRNRAVWNAADEKLRNERRK